MKKIPTIWIVTAGAFLLCGIYIFMAHCAEMDGVKIGSIRGLSAAMLGLSALLLGLAIAMKDFQMRLQKSKWGFAIILIFNFVVYLGVPIFLVAADVSGSTSFWLTLSATLLILLVVVITALDFLDQLGGGPAGPAGPTTTTRTVTFKRTRKGMFKRLVGLPIIRPRLVSRYAPTAGEQAWLDLPRPQAK